MDEADSTKLPRAHGDESMLAARCLAAFRLSLAVLTRAYPPCSVHAMEQVNARAGRDLELVATERGLTAGFWFYVGFFYASPAVLAERESRMT